MKIVVLGSGVIGVTTAFYLARAGHAVTVLDRQPGPGIETGFADAGEVSPGYSPPWAGPGVPCKAIKWLAIPGVEFRYGVNIRKLVTANGLIASVMTDRGEVSGDAYVVALGSYSPLLLKRIGISIPVYPIEGYSITLPVTDPSGAPESTVMDETCKVAITRLGDRIRVGGTAEIAGYDLQLHPSRRTTLEHSVVDLFGGGGDLLKAEFWAGLRPMTPDGRRSSARPNTPTSIAIPGMGRSDGRWRAAPRTCLRTSSQAPRWQSRRYALRYPAIRRGDLSLLTAGSPSRSSAASFRKQCR